MKKMQKKLNKFLLGFSLLSLLTIPFVTSAQWNTGLNLATSTSRLPTTDFLLVLVSILLWLFSVLTLLSVIAFVAAGIMLIISGGNADLASRARRWITYAIFGLAVALASLSIVITIATLIGIPFLSTVFTLLGMGMPGMVDSIFLRIMLWLLLVLTYLAVIAFVASGLMLILSGGDPNVTGRAKKWIIYSIIGLAVAIGAYSIIRLVADLV